MLDTLVSKHRFDNKLFLLSRNLTLGLLQKKIAGPSKSRDTSSGWNESSNSRNASKSRYASNARTPETARTSNRKDAATAGTPGTKGTPSNTMDDRNSRNASKSTDASNSNDISNSRDSGNNNSRMLTRAGASITAEKPAGARYNKDATATARTPTTHGTKRPEGKPSN